LSTLGEEEVKLRALRDISSVHEEGVHIPQLMPDTQLLCFDFLFYVAFPDPESENIKDSSMKLALDSIGLHLHFSRQLEDIAKSMLWSALSERSHRILNGMQLNDRRFPPYIAVHVRRGDFEQYCSNDYGAKGQDRSACFTPLGAYAEAVESVRSELLTRESSSFDLTEREVRDLPVLIFSDEPKHTNSWFLNRFHRPPGSSESWWFEVDRLGWIPIDHQAAKLDTERKWGYWYPILVDSVMMSHAVGFVGTSRSTFSLMAGKRIEAWANGPVRMVEPVLSKS